LNNFTIGKNSSASLELTCNLGETTQEQLKALEKKIQALEDELQQVKQTAQGTKETF